MNNFAGSSILRKNIGSFTTLVLGVSKELIAPSKAQPAFTYCIIPSAGAPWPEPEDDEAEPDDF